MNGQPISIKGGSSIFIWERRALRYRVESCKFIAFLMSLEKEHMHELNKIIFETNNAYRIFLTARIQQEATRKARKLLKEIN